MSGTFGSGCCNSVGLATAGQLEVFQTDSTLTEQTDEPGFVLMDTLASSPKVKAGQVWRISLTIKCRNNTPMFNRGQVRWRIETASGVFSEFGRWEMYSPPVAYTIVGSETAPPYTFIFRQSIVFDAPRCEVEVRDLGLNPVTDWFFITPTWGGHRIS